MKTGAYGHDPFKCTRVWSLVHAKASESIVVPQVVDIESTKLRKGGGQEGRKLF